MNVPFVIRRPCPSAHPSSVGYTQIGGVEEFSVVAGVVLLVEKCEESEVSELRSGEQRGVAQERLRFIFFEFRLIRGAIGQGDPISPLFHEGATRFLINYFDHLASVGS